MKNKLKSIVKRILPNKLVKFIYRRRVLEKLYNLCKSVKKLEAIPPDLIHGPRIVFMLQFPEAWNSFCTVYEAALIRGLSVIVLCIPTFHDEKKYEYISGNGLTNDAYEFCLNNKFVCVNAWQNGKWFNMEEFNPDYVIYSRPYNSLYPREYRSGIVCRYAKICYIPYGYTLTTGHLMDTVFNLGFITDTYITFTHSKTCMRYCKRRFRLKSFFQSKSFVYLGYPRFDLYTLMGQKTDTEKIHILWLPRWTTPTENNNQQSHFFDFFDQLMNYVEYNNKLELMIRPHPLMFSNFIEKGVLTEQEVDDIIHKVEKLNNVSFDTEKDYIHTLKRADIIVSDFSSLIIEGFVTEKPIIFCDVPDDFDEDALLMDSVLYHAYRWEELKEHLDMLIEGRDPNLESRKEIIRKMIPNFDGHIGTTILNCIIADYEQR